MNKYTHKHAHTYGKHVHIIHQRAPFWVFRAFFYRAFHFIPQDFIHLRGQIFHTHHIIILFFSVNFPKVTPVKQSHLWSLSQCGTRWDAQGPKVQYHDTCPWRKTQSGDIQRSEYYLYQKRYSHIAAKGPLFITQLLRYKHCDPEGSIEKICLYAPFLWYAFIGTHHTNLSASVLFDRSSFLQREHFSLTFLSWILQIQWDVNGDRFYTSIRPIFILLLVCHSISSFQAA